jgi:hypothetical protein
MSTTTTMTTTTTVCRVSGNSVKQSPLSRQQ